MFQFLQHHSQCLLITFFTYFIFKNDLRIFQKRYMGRTDFQINNRNEFQIDQHFVSCLPQRFSSSYNGKMSRKGAYHK